MLDRLVAQLVDVTEGVVVDVQAVDVAIQPEGQGVVAGWHGEGPEQRFARIAPVEPFDQYAPPLAADVQDRRVLPLHRHQPQGVGGIGQESDGKRPKPLDPVGSVIVPAIETLVG